MRKETIHREKTGLFSSFQNLLAYDQSGLDQLIPTPFSLESCKKQLALKSNTYDSNIRKILVDELNAQYAGLDFSEATRTNLEWLKTEKGFTVTTGHQLSLFTGPLFFCYKIIHTIRLAQELNKGLNDHHVVPVFWMASEDHDFEEINSVELFNRTYTWETNQEGAVGRFDTHSLENLIHEVSTLFKEKIEVESILDTYRKGNSLAQATRNLVHALFDRFGLVILDADNHRLKEVFVPVMVKEIQEQPTFQAVHQANTQLEQAGIQPQVHVREVNLFYLHEKGRFRIVKTEEDVFTIEEVGTFTAAELIANIELEPQRFSPNVCLRPIYQELILPNLVYTGGVGELSYWLQLPHVFKAYGVCFPLLAVRTSALWIDQATFQKIEKSGFGWQDMFTDIHELKRNYVNRFSGDEVDFSQIDHQLSQLSSALTTKIIEVDPGLEKLAQAQVIKLQKEVSVVREKLFKSLKQRHENSLSGLDQVFQRLFPNNRLQERSLNLFQLCRDGNIAHRIDFMMQEIDPFDPDLHVFFDA